jgi:hypothetical protein
MGVIFWAFGVIGIILFHEGIHMPIIASAALIVLSAWYIVKSYHDSRVGPLTMLLFLVYTLPFIHIFPYLWFDFGAESALFLWGFPVNPYMTDKAIIELMSMIGAVGAAGFVSGTSLLRGKLLTAWSCPGNGRYPVRVRTISMQVFLVYIALAIGLTWISAPEETVFTTAYAQSASLHSRWNFSSAWMFSYAFLVFALADSIFESSSTVGKAKRKIILISVLLIVTWFQLLRGDRESLTFVVAALIMYYAWGKGIQSPAIHRVKVKWPMAVSLVLVVFVTSYAVANMRFLLAGVGNISDLVSVVSELRKEGVIGLDNLLSGTWSGVLLTPLSVAGDYLSGTLPLRYGQTYLDLIISILPGFLADLIGYQRPIDTMHGPAWEMVYGGGGIHAVVVPFMDFRMVGVFVIVAAWSCAFAAIERYSMRCLNVSRLALLGTIAMSAPHWLWYGEKNIMNALIIWLLLALFYRVRLTTGLENPKNYSRQRSTTPLSNSWHCES